MNIDELLNLAKQKEQEGNIFQAVNILKKAYDDISEGKNYILLELGELYFRNEMHMRSIETLVKCYEATGMSDIRDLLINRYYGPNKQLFKKNYTKNKNNLKNYKYFYGDFKEANEKIIWINEEKIIYFYENKFKEYLFPKNNLNNIKSGEIVLLQNCLDKDEIDFLLRKTYRENFLWSKDPVYLYYDINEWNLFVQLYDLELENFFEYERIVFCQGEIELINVLSDLQSQIPGTCINVSQRIFSKINDLINNRYNKINLSIKEIKKYYKKNENKIINNIKKGAIKILFITSRFTTAAQYHIRDCKIACEELGIKTKLLIEKSDIHTNLDAYVNINEFKPDIIFIIDHFRFEYPHLPPGVIFVTWIQDDLPLILDEDTPQKLVCNDFILNMFVTSEKIKNLYCGFSNLMDGYIPANDNIYKSYQMNKFEIADYSADICVVANASDYNNQLKDIINFLSSSISIEFIEKLVKQIYELFYNGEFISDFKKFIINYAELANYSLSNYLIDILADEFEMKLRYSLLRTVVVEWLIDSGYRNLKLWGNQWHLNEKFKPYACGIAENGEKLSKILQSSKIVLNIHSGVTAPAKAFETMLSGTFYLANYLPPEKDWADIRKIMIEDKDFVFFYSKQDLLKKINYYLSHESERKKIAQNGKNKAQQNMTYKQLMKKMFEEIRSKL